MEQNEEFVKETYIQHYHLSKYHQKEVLVLMKNGAWVEGGARVNDFYEKVKLF